MKDAVCITYRNKLSIKVDPCDVDVAAAHSWSKNTSGHVVRGVHRGGKLKMLLLHRVITGAKDGEQVDHINGDKTDNRRRNLRICNNAQNQQNRGRLPNNTTGFKGVSFNKRSGKYVARVMANGTSRFLGYHSTAEAAYAVFCEAGREMHGEFFNPG